MGKLNAPAFAKPVQTKWAQWQWRTMGRAVICISFLQEAGFTGDELRQMAAVWMAESQGDRHAFHINAPGKGADLGPAQINRPWVEMPDDDPRRSLQYSAFQSRRLFLERGFQPWYAHGTKNWVDQFPYVDAAIGCLSPTDRKKNGWP